MAVGEDSEVTDLRRILSAAMDLAILVLIGISDFFITVSFAMADFFVITISSLDTVSSLVLTSRHSDSPGGGTLMMTGTRIPMLTMATLIPIVTNHQRTVVTRHRMESNIGVTWLCQCKPNSPSRVTTMEA